MRRVRYQPATPHHPACRGSFKWGTGFALTGLRGPGAALNQRWTGAGGWLIQFSVLQLGGLWGVFCKPSRDFPAGRSSSCPEGHSLLSSAPVLRHLCFLVSFLESPRVISRGHLQNTLCSLPSGSAVEGAQARPAAECLPL